MSLVGRFLTGEYTVIRSQSGTYVRGRYVAGPTEEIKVDGSLQPSNARELKLPEEGNRLRQYWKLYSDEPVLVNSMATLAKGDKVVINGELYRAMALTSWQDVDLPYHMTVLWREPEQASDGKGSTK